MKKIGIALCSTLAALLLVEGAHRTVLRARGSPYARASAEEDLRRSVEAVTRREPGMGPAGAPDARADEHSPLKLILHPYYAYETDLSLAQVAEEVAHFRSPKARKVYEVLVLGGSVAAGFAGAGEARFRDVVRSDPRLGGMPVQLLSHARGSYKQPQQVMTLAYLLGLGYRPDAVLNIDGFNELAQANENAARRYHPLYPSHGQWTPLVRGGATDRDLMDRMLEVRAKQRAIEFSAGKALRYRLTASSLLGSLAGSRVDRLRKEWIAAQDAYLELAEAADEAGVTRGPPFQGDLEEVLRTSVRGWSESAANLQAMCDERSILYVGVVQPALHDEGSKQLTRRERRSGVTGPAWRDAVRAGYPRLREAAERLRAKGVNVMDRTDVFREVTETVYIDPCHFNARGQELFAEAVAGAFLASLPPR